FGLDCGQRRVYQVASQSLNTPIRKVPRFDFPLFYLGFVRANVFFDLLGMCRLSLFMFCL
ncbi:MAG: hypothetical protein OXT67_04620, partial [Zetaproteobacteria bacterium]|nr:hypothetical protein [Zetaproteobacteria bacterium]